MGVSIGISVAPRDAPAGLSTIWYATLSQTMIVDFISLPFNSAGLRQTRTQTKSVSVSALVSSSAELRLHALLTSRFWPASDLWRCNLGQKKTSVAGKEG